MSKIEQRLRKSIKQRSAKSPMSSTATETLLLKPEKSDTELKSILIPQSALKRNSSQLFKKSLKAENPEYFRIILEKNSEINKLKEENQVLASQNSELIANMKKYQKLRRELKEKDQILSALKLSIEKSKPIHHNDIGLATKPKQTSGKTLKRSMSKIKSRLSLDTNYQSLDIFSERPSIITSALVSTKTSPCKSKKNLNPSNNIFEFSKILGKTEKILKGWKKAYQSQ